jgi:DNA-binding NarL/FixJ family response regulator
MPTKRPAVLDILIAHDDEIVRIGLRTLLKDYRGLRICGESDTAADTLKKVKKLQPGMLILKLDLPDKGGTEIIPELLKLRPGLRVMLIATVGPAMESGGVLTPGVAKRALEEGALGLLLKPDAQDIRLAVEALSGNKSFVSSNMFAGMTSGAMPRTDHSALSNLTAREVEVFKRIAAGKSTKEIAADLRISPRTAEVHRANILHKLGFHSHAELILFASQNNLI